MKLYFVRHGQSLANTLGIYNNRPDHRFGLTKTGLLQAYSLAQELSHLNLAAVHSSPLLRAQQTAAIISQTLKVPLYTTDALTEYDTGILEGQPYSDATTQLYQANEDHWLVKGHPHHRLKEGESYNDIQSRFLPFINKLHQDTPANHNLLLVSHGGLYRCMLPLILSNISIEFARNNVIDHTQIIVAEYRNGQLVCLSWGNQHLTTDQ